MSDPEVFRFLPSRVHPDPEHTLAIIRTWINEYRAGSMDWCITLRGSREPIGSITAVQDFPERRYCEIGYCLSQRYWDQGYMTEAVRAVTRYIFDTTDYLWIQARYDTENEASGRCLEKSNYSCMGEMELPDPKTGRPRTYRFMRITRSDLLLM